MVVITLVLELINRCLRTLGFRHVVCHVGERTEAGIFVHRKGRTNGEWKFLQEKLTKISSLAAPVTVPPQSFNICRKSCDGFRSPRSSTCKSCCKRCPFEGQARFCNSFSVLYKELLAVAE